jgi:hypothetical protein
LITTNYARCYRNKDTAVGPNFLFIFDVPNGLNISICAVFTMGWQMIGNSVATHCYNGIFNSCKSHKRHVRVVSISNGLCDNSHLAHAFWPRTIFVRQNSHTSYEPLITLRRVHWKATNCSFYIFL